MLSYHWIPVHRDQTDRDWFISQQPRFIKVISDGNQPPQAEDVIAAGAGYICRIYPVSENLNWGGRDLVSLSRAAEIGRIHAGECAIANAWLRSHGLPQNRIWFEGLNEPQLWTAQERPALVAAYYRAFLDSIHGFGGRAVVGNFGVGWPNNDGPNTPPNWGFFAPVFEAMIVSGSYWDYLGLHEYWALNGPEENWAWWAGRCLQCPARVPILITEFGIDTLVAGGSEHHGWRALPGTHQQQAARFVDEQWRYMDRLCQDDRIQGVMGFTYDQSQAGIWWEFNLRDNVYKQEVMIQRSQVGMPEPLPFTPEPPPPPVGDFRKPFDGDYPVTDDFAAHLARGSSAPGVDYATPMGTPARAVADAVVLSRAMNSVSGRFVELMTRTAEGWHRVTYRHLNDYIIRPGWDVHQGDIIGHTGRTGNATGPCLHVDVTHGENWPWMDPQELW